MTRQTAFDLHAAADALRGRDVHGLATRAARTALAGWASWSSGVLVLVGPRGAGKTHLAGRWADQVGARFIGPGARRQAAGAPTGGSQELEAYHAVDGPFVWDDADTARDDEGLFTAIDAAIAGRARPGLFTARTAPSGWPVNLPDLVSRLRLAPVVEVHPPSRADLFECVAGLLAARGVDAPVDAVAYVVRGLAPDFSAAQDAAARLDQAALAQGGRVTLRLAKEIMNDRHDPQAPDAQASERPERGSSRDASGDAGGPAPGQETSRGDE